MQRRGFGPPPGFSQPDASGARHPVFHRTALRSADPRHSWAAAHVQCDGGRMDGFFKSSGNAAIGFYTADELPFYYSLFDAPDAVLCANYFCSILGPTSPNRLYLMSGTSGGITSNGYCCFGILDSARWPIILDLLEEAGVTWRIYNRGGLDDVLGSDVDNVAWLWSRWAHDPRTSGTYDEYLRDCAIGTLPAVSWLIPSYAQHLDEHPPNDVAAGMRLQQQAIGALRSVSTLAALGVPAQLRRARRLLRPRRAAADRRVRAWHPRAALGDLAAAAAPGRRRDAPAGGARLDAQADRARARPAHARVAQPRVRPRDADGSWPRHVRRARPSARRAERDQRPDGAVRPRPPRPDERRRNGISKTDAKARANTIVNGRTRAIMTRKAGTPWRTRPATIFS